MVDLFTDIPDDLIESTLQTIRENLDKVGLFGGHTLRRHTDIQLILLLLWHIRKEAMVGTTTGEEIVLRKLSVRLSDMSENARRIAEERTFYY